MTLNPVLRIGTQMVEAVLAHEEVCASAAASGARTLGHGRHPVAGRAAGRLSAPVLRRHASAGRDRDRATAPAGPDHRRRADHRARRHHPVADPDADPEACRGNSARPDVDQPRSRRRRGSRPSDRGHVCRSHRRDRPDRRRPRPAAFIPTRSACCNRSAPTSARAGPAGRSPAWRRRSLESAAGLCVPPALLRSRRDLRDGAADSNAPGTPRALLSSATARSAA